MSEADGVAEAKIKCGSCGAELSFAPGTVSLKCQFCGAVEEIDTPETGAEAIEFDFAEALRKVEQQLEGTPREEFHTIACKGCGASTTLDPNVVSESCPFCGLALKNDAAIHQSLSPPHYVLPFGLDENQARTNYQTWIRKLWFAPSSLKKYAREEGKLKGMYLPFFTFDSRVTTDYLGMRGTYYYTTERYTVRVNGRTETRTRQVRHTRWTSVSGTVGNLFDDVLVPTTRSVPEAKLIALEPWNLKRLKPYNHAFIQGFRSEVCVRPLRESFDYARARMEPQIRGSVLRDIGGDTQRITSMQSSYADVTYKSIQLPVWINAYRFNGKLYQFLVNADTGEVQGERPYSWVKITLAAMGGAAAIAGILLWLNHMGVFNQM